MYRGHLAAAEFISDSDSDSEESELKPPNTTDYDDYNYNYGTTDNTSMDIDCDHNHLGEDHNSLIELSEDNHLTEDNGLDEDNCLIEDGDIPDTDNTDGWPEPKREEAPMDYPIPDAIRDDDRDNDDAQLGLGQDSGHRRQAEWILVESGDGPKPQVTIRYTEKHRHSCAGSILNHASAHDDQYASTVNYDENVWAPFKSKLDWDLARWAKMRGPGSTALSELLAIDGVSS